ncbi:hypothetical protein EG68_08899 [Paragonimus skrjabini miyazakii]|uniref:Uncharacterized protein n=1 Tax=Paragonimus skrjabini miyazakii TaxID=59628 RepID=A0A8S9YJ74_9TREM|nr:hypothetical protein EG68_08899 [Paragonimus skrjabini miyazakii]
MKPMALRKVCLENTNHLGHYKLTQELFFTSKYGWKFQINLLFR